MTENFSGLSKRFKPWGFVRLNVGGGSFSWSLADGSGGNEGTLKPGCSFALDDLADASEEAGVDFDCEPYDLGEDDREKGPSLAGISTGWAGRCRSLSCGGLGSAHDTLGDEGFRE